MLLESPKNTGSQGCWEEPHAEMEAGTSVRLSAPRYRLVRLLFLWMSGDTFKSVLIL